MPGAETYQLHIDAFEPGTIPMSRLAKYLTGFAGLLGHSEHVHFTDLKPGSLTLAACVDSIAQPKVARRVDEIRLGAGSHAAKEAFQEIDDLLAQDNAVGSILHGAAKVIEFPGRTRPVEVRLGPVKQPSTLVGEVIQIGGRDETINVHLKSGDKFHPCVTSKAIARGLATHIFGGPIRLHGQAAWARLGSGEWELKNFQITSFEPLDETPLSQLLDGLRSRSGPPPEGRPNPADLMRLLRED